VRDCGGHLADGGQPVAQAFAFLELLHASQVLEEHRRADHAVVVVPDERERVSDDSARKAKPELRAIREQVQVEYVRQQPYHLWVVAQHLRGRSPEVVGATLDPENAVGLVVDNRECAIAIQRQYAVAHACDHMPEERVLHGAGTAGWRAGTLHGGRPRRPAGSHPTARLRHRDLLHGSRSLHYS
jgi:hypothetical protein